MKPNADPSKAPESKPGSSPNAKDDLKSIPMSELQAKLGSSPDGLSQAEAQKQFVGVLPLFDPPREQAKATISKD